MQSNAPSQPSGKPRPFGVDRLARLMEMERRHFWFQGREALIKQLAGRYLNSESRVLDLGCGSGWMSSLLRTWGYSVIGLDFLGEGVRLTHAADPGLPLLQADALRLPFASECFGGIVALDILEHVDDLALLREAARVLKPGGMVLLTVPALPCLWSYRDEAAGHLRRYSRHQLERLLGEVRLAARDIRYYQFWLSPVVVLTRLLGKRGPWMSDAEERPMPFLNSVLSAVNRMEVGLSRYVSWPWGSSLVAVCRKEGS